MEQENVYEDEIDLKELLYVIFRKWRGLIICALVFAVAAGGYKYFAFSAGDAEAEAMESYEKALADREKARADLETQLESSEAVLKLLEDYAEGVDMQNISVEDLAVITENMLSVQDRVKSVSDALDSFSEEEPMPEVPSSGAVKYGALGFVLGGFLGVFAVCVSYLMSDKVRSMKDLQRRFGLRSLGSFEGAMKRNGPIDRLIDRMFGVKGGPSFEEACGIMAANTANYLSEGSKKILLTGSAAKADVEKAAEILRAQTEGEGFLNLPVKPEFISEELITDPKTIRALASCDEVILVERKGASRMSDLEEELMLLKNLEKKVTGAVLF